MNGPSQAHTGLKRDAICILNTDTQIDFAFIVITFICSNFRIVYSNILRTSHVMAPLTIFVMSLFSFILWHKSSIKEVCH